MGTTTEGIKIVSDGNKWTYAQASDQAYWPVNDGESLDFTPIPRTGMKLSRRKLSPRPV